jgi:MFS superfamily sulfate permease-like transporter
MQKTFGKISKKFLNNKINISSLFFLKTEVLAGLTVSLALVPEAVSFSFVAGVHPSLEGPHHPLCLL